MVFGTKRNEQVIEVVAPQLGATLDDLDVVGGKDGDEDRPQHVIVAAQGLAIEPEPVPASQIELGLDQEAPTAPVGVGSQHGLLLPAAHQQPGRRPPEAVQGGKVGDRLQQVGLTGTVFPLQQGHTLAGRLQLRRDVVAKIGKRYLLYVHDRTATRRGPVQATRTGMSR